MDEKIEQQAPTTKRCTKCGIEKPLAEFYKHKSRRDGLSEQCRSCNAEGNRAYREANREALRVQKKGWYEANKKRILVSRKSYRETNRKVISAWKKAYYKANKEIISVQKKADYEANKRMILARVNRYREANKETINARKKAYYHANKEAFSARKKIYHKMNKETIQLKVKAWQKQNPERYQKKMRELAGRRRARMRGTVVVPFTAAMEQAKYEEQDGRCYYRGEKLNGIYDIEHKVPLSRGGAHSQENIVLACRRCNNRKFTMTDIEFLDLIKAESAEEVA